MGSRYSNEEQANFSTKDYQADQIHRGTRLSEDGSMNARAIILGILAHVAVLVGYLLLTIVASSVAPIESTLYLYLQQEATALCDLVASILPAFVLAKYATANPWRTSVVLRIIAFVPSFISFGNHLGPLITSRPISYHAAFLLLSGISASYFWTRKVGRPTH